MLPFDMVPLLCCPTCKAPELGLKITTQTRDGIDEGTLTCSACGESFPIRSGVPSLLPQRALSTPEWTQWKEHLRGLQNRRRHRPSYKRWQDATRMDSERAFIEFAGMTEGNLLDVGCGKGNLRACLDEQRLRY